MGIASPPTILPSNLGTTWLSAGIFNQFFFTYCYTNKIKQMFNLGYSFKDLF